MAKKSRKVFATTATAALVASAVAPIASSAAGYSDVTKPEYKTAIDALSDAGILNGYGNGLFKPENKVTRGEVAKVITLIRHLGEGTKTPFKDVKDGYWSTQYINSLYAAKLINGYEDGTFKPEGNITRAEFAKLVVQAYGLDLSSAATPFKDVKAGNWATPYIQTAYANGLVNGVTTTTFQPNAPIKRGDLALLLYRADSKFGDVIGGVTGSVTGIKATSATTVEVSFKDAVKDVKASDFAIEGLTVSNAAVKQTDNKTVVLTTSTQEGGKEYTVKSGADTLGKFKGISAVIPTTIKAETTSVQGVVGKEVTLKADIGVKQAGVPVTFNVKAGDKLNKDQVEEVYTDANGIATYSYTQYASGYDDVAVYPTGAPSVRSLASVYWGVSQILDIKAADEKQGNTVNNGGNKVYKVTYKDPKTGTPVANQKLHVTFAENVDVNVDKLSKATINGVNPEQLLNGTKPTTAVVTTDSKGEATFTVSGTNTKVTPVVFVDELDSNKNSINTLTATKLQAKAEQVTFSAVQAEYTIDITRDGGEEAATGLTNGRDYKIVVKTKDGKEAANEVVNVAFNEDIDRNINTNTSAYFVKDDVNVGKQITVKLDSKGEGTFTVSSDTVKDYATPIAWIDINTSNAKEGKFDDGEPSKVAAISYFAAPKLTAGTVTPYKNGTTTELKTDQVLNGTEFATFTFAAANQSGKEMVLPTDYKHISTSFTVHNTGSSDVYVDGDKTKVVSPNRSLTITKEGSAPSITVQPLEDTTASVRVEATGTAVGKDNTIRSVYLGNHSATAAFKSTKVIDTEHKGLITAFDTENKTITFEGKNKVSYKGKNATFYDESNGNAVRLTESEFASALNGNNVQGRLFISGDNYRFSIVSSTPKPAAVTVQSAVAYDTNNDSKADVIEVTFSKAITDSKLDVSKISLTNGKVASVATGTANDATVTLNVTDATNLELGTLTIDALTGLATDGADFAKYSQVLATATVHPLAQAKADLNKAITDANALYDGATEGAAAGEYATGSKADYKAAIDQAVLVSRLQNPTVKELQDAKTALDTATETFKSKQNS